MERLALAIEKYSQLVDILTAQICPILASVPSATRDKGLTTVVATTGLGKQIIDATMKIAETNLRLEEIIGNIEV
jgi:uncharacterized hydantoinase/oxoprolinase family protein